MEKLINKLNEIADLIKEAGQSYEYPRKPLLLSLAREIHKIALLVDAARLKAILPPTNGIHRNGLLVDRASLVAVRLVEDDKTYLGIYIGDLATSATMQVTDKGIQFQWSGYNSAILVPELNRLVHGYESWWTPIESEEDLKEISDADIPNQWYVQMLKKFKKNN